MITDSKPTRINNNGATKFQWNEMKCKKANFKNEIEILNHWTNLIIQTKPIKKNPSISINKMPHSNREENRSE